MGVVPKFAPPRVIAVDVDGTLAVSGRANAEVIAYLKKRKADGFALVLWSSQGEDHAREAAQLFGVTDLFAHILSKPGYILDDRGWSWIKFTRVIRRLHADAV